MSALAELFRFAIGRFQASGLETVVAAAVPASEEADQLIAEGFYRVPVRFYLNPEYDPAYPHPSVQFWDSDGLAVVVSYFGDYDVL